MAGKGEEKPKRKGYRKASRAASLISDRVKKVAGPAGLTDVSPRTIRIMRTIS